MQFKTLIAASALALAGAAQAQPAPGISQHEILLGSIQDLSGPVAGMGKQARMGLQMRVNEANAEGGIHGRTIRLLVEDSGYDTKKAVLAAQKLSSQNKVFAVVGHLGTPTNIAAMPVQFSKGVFNFLPLSSGREMFEPFHKLKYSSFSTYYDQLRLATPQLVTDKKAQKICTLYQDDELGLEIMRGAEEGLKTIGKSFTEKTTYKRGATDFSSQIQKLAAAQCDFVVLGTVIRETVGSIATARKIGFNPTFLGSGAAYVDLIPKLGGPGMDGFYTTMSVQHPYMDEASEPLRAWAQRFKREFNEEPNVFAVYGYNAMDTFIRAARKAGPNLSTESFILAMDDMVVPPDIFGSSELHFSARQRQGSAGTRLSQIQNGRWVVVTNHIRPAP